ncbi:(2Fe-2S)-binding protein [Kitasatospora cineracea]|uniref:(2Fe-2S)-binding protein n=1 Tax=Kitasatospora cineracea TaxID=88074 RepID=UPI0036DE1AF2
MLDLPARPAPATGRLALTYRQLARACPALTLSLVDGDPAGGALAGGASAGGAPVGGREWIPVDRLASAVERLVDAEAVRIRDRHGLAPRPHVAASRLLHHHLWTTSLLISGVWYLEGRIPLLPAGHLWTDAATGDFALRPGDWAPGDEAALRDAVAAHVGPVLAAFQPLVRRGPRALWGMATDDLLSGLWYLGRMLGEEDRAVAAATALLPADARPWTGPANFRREQGGWTRTRQGCCLYYAVDPANPCATCPRRA